MTIDKEKKLTVDELATFCKRKGFVYPSGEIYGGLAGFWDFGHLGVELKNNIKKEWWNFHVYQREDIVGIDGSIITNPKVWKASGHIDNFIDVYVKCKKCKKENKIDKKDLGRAKCKFCNGEYEVIADFNLMFKTAVGPIANEKSFAYLRPETAQLIFSNFKLIAENVRLKLPFGIAQIGKAFRNEISPRDFLFRCREFEQMEIEYFFAPPKTDAEWQEEFDGWRKMVLEWIHLELGISENKIFEHDIPDGERAHYSKKTIDFEYEFPFGRSELYGLAYRTDYDLKNHGLNYKDLITGEEFVPHVIEPSMGVDRSILAVLLESYKEDNGRVYLKLPKRLAPYKVAVFPLLPNKPELVLEAEDVYETLKKEFTTIWDDRGNIGKRYASQDEIGTPFCITFDFDSLEDEKVTVRDRDTGKQERVKIVDLSTYLHDKIN